jgi:prepilin-type processing-associated H-X9-DG protein
VGPGCSVVDAGAGDTSIYQFSPVEARHGRFGNVVFVDGHASAMTLERLGYELNESGMPIPILDSLTGTYKASNKVWNGEGSDEIAEKRRPTS